MKNDLTTGSVWKRLLMFALPIFGANLLQSLYGTVDLMIVGLFSSAESVSAVATGSMIMQSFSMVIIGLTMGSTILLGQKIGMRDEKSAARAVASSVALFTVFGLILTAVVVCLAAPISTAMNAPAEAFDGTVSYIRICGAGIICIVMFNALCGMFRGIGDSRTPLILMIIACTTNIIGDLILVGLCGMKGDGAAIATVAAQGISVLSAFFIIKKRGFGFPADKNELKPHWDEMKLILKFGIPIAAQEALTGLSFAIIQSILNGFGLIASAGVGVAQKITGLMFIVPGAMMSGVSAFTAQNIGAEKPERAKKSMYYGIVMTIAVGILMYAISFFFGEWLAGFFTKDTDIMAAAADFLKSSSMDCIIVGAMFSMMGYLNGNGKTAFVAAQGILSTFLVRIPVSFLISRSESASLFKIGFATPLSTVFGIILTAIYIIIFEKKKKSLALKG